MEASRLVSFALRITHRHEKLRTSQSISMRLLILLGLAMGLAGCNRPKTTAEHPVDRSPAEKTTGPFVNACDLLASADIQAVQGEPLQNAVPSNQAGAGMAVSQCYFGTPTGSKSISLTVWQRVDRTSKDPREFWKERFHGDGDTGEGEGEDEETRAKLRQQLVPVPDLGDEAFWSGTNIGGALYVLKGDRFFRVGIGGAGDQATRIKKTKALAQAILKRW